ncbi:unnamed protein product [Sphagnum balticum]
MGTSRSVAALPLGHILLLGKDFSRAFERQRNRSLTDKNVMRLLKPRDQVCLLVVVGWCYPNVNATTRKCCGLKGQAGCLGFPKDLQATPPSPTTDQ